METLPACQRECVRPLHDSIRGVLRTTQYVEKYHRVCRSYKKARKCVAEERERCGESGDLFDVLSSGFHYMCIEQGKAFKANIECIDREAHQVKAACEEECSKDNHLVTILARTGIAKQFGELLGGLRSGEFAPAFGERPVPLDPGQSHLGVDPKTGNELGLLNNLNNPRADSSSYQNFLEIAHEACTYVECALGCLRTKYNTRCKDVGALIVETLMRPVVEGHRRFSPFFLALSATSPTSCKFLYSASRLLRFRIDPKLHEDLLRTYGTTDEDEDVDTSSAIDADSDLERLINMVYANETFEEGNEADLFNATSLSEDDINRVLAEKYLRSKAPQRVSETPEDVNQWVEGSAEGSAEGSGMASEAVFRWTLSKSTTSVVLTPNVTGFLNCRLIYDEL